MGDSMRHGGGEVGGVMFRSVDQFPKRNSRSPSTTAVLSGTDRLLLHQFNATAIGGDSQGLSRESWTTCSNCSGVKPLTIAHRFAGEWVDRPAGFETNR